MNAITTGAGDGGTTSLYSGQRVSKTSARIEALGTMDELQASLGLARSYVSNPQLNDDILFLEKLLVRAMEEVATLESSPLITSDDLAWLEGRVDEYVPETFSFRLPGNTTASAAMHVARTVARRCERRVDALLPEGVSSVLLSFMNRISDFCYAVACFEDQKHPQR